MTKEISVHIDSSEVREGIPPMGQAKKCNKPECPAPNFTVGFGLAGGGFGPYEYCEVCGNVVSKTNEDSDAF